MYTFNKSFEQFKNNALHLALVNLLYSITIAITYILLNCLIPIVGPILYLAVFMVSTSIYLRILMQVVNNKTPISFDDAKQGILPVAGRMFLLNLVKGLVLTIVAIPCVFLNMFNIVSLINQDADGFQTIIKMFVLLGGTIFVIVIVSIVLELILGFVNLLISDKDFAHMSFKDSVINGVKMMKGYRCRFVFIQIINVFLVFIGFLMLGVGFFFTSPLSTLLILNLYKEAKDSYLGCDVKNEVNSYSDENQESVENSIKFDDFLKKN